MMKTLFYWYLLQLALLQLLLSGSQGTPTVQFSSSAYTIMEGGTGGVTVNVMDLGSDAVTLIITATPVSATEGTDYTALSPPITYMFDSLTPSNTFSISTLEDSVFEDNEVFMVFATANMDSMLNLVAGATVTITDDDDVTVSMRDSTLMATESSGSVEVCARLDGPTGGLGRTVDIQLTQNGQAAVTKTFPSGAMPGAIQCLSVSIQNDNVFEDDETFTVSLSSTQSRVTASGITAITVQDDDDVTVSLRDSTLMTTESSDSVEVCAQLDGPAGGLGRTVDIQLAQSGQASVTRTFTSGAMPGATQCLRVSIQNDDRFEDDETFIVSLSSTQSRVTATGTTTVTVQDDDDVTVSMRDSTLVTTESSGSVEVCARLDGPTGGLGRMVDIQLNDVTRTFNSGAMPGATQCLSVSIQNDDRFEDDETFTVSLSSSQSRVTATGTTIVTVQDDDDPVVGLAQTSYTVREGTDSSVRVCAELRGPQGGLARGFTVALTANAGTAEQERDYMASDYTTTRTFQTYVTVGTERCFSPTIPDDNIGESIETFTVTLSPNEPRVMVEGSSVATVTIEDNDFVSGGLMPGGFTVTATGSRSLSFSWSSPSQPTHTILGYTVSCSSSGRETFMMDYPAAGTYEESGFTPYTTYNCRVFARIDGNRGEDATDSVRTHEEAPGSPPTSVILSSVTSTLIGLSWEPPLQSYGLITHYTLYINYTNGTEIARRTVSQSTATIAQLQPYQNVRVAISASNSAGEGASQTTFNARTNESSPGLVREVRFSALNDAALAVSWMPPARLNGELQHYTVRVSSPLNGSLLEINTTSLSVQLTGLEPFVPYKVSVLAVNSAGEGEAVTQYEFTKEGVPSVAPKNVTAERLNNGDVRVTWVALTPLEARGKVTNYTVYYWIKGEDMSTAMTEHVSGDSTFIIIKGLDTSKVYLVAVAASTSAGMGNATEPIEVPTIPLSSTIDTYVWGLVGGLAFTLVNVLIITLFVIGFCCWRSRSKKTPKEEHNKETCASPEYEEIQLPARDKAAGGDVKTGRCVAYGMVNTGQQAGGDETQLTANYEYDTVA